MASKFSSEVILIEYCWVIKNVWLEFIARKILVNHTILLSEEIFDF